MPKIEYIGREAVWAGKSLPMICMKLKNFGIGRLFTCDLYKRFPEVSYYILTKAEVDMSDPYLKRGEFHAKFVYRGEQMEGFKTLEGWKEHFQLVAKEDEKYFMDRTLKPGETRVPKQEIKPFVLPPFVKYMYEHPRTF